MEVPIKAPAQAGPNFGNCTKIILFLHLLLVNFYGVIG